jgi:predicted SAM-dependent methyltransferase
MDDASLAQIGAVLRRLPGARFPLDARNFLRARRSALAAERRWGRRDRQWLASLRGRNDLKLNIGSSGEFLDGWINADLGRDAEGRCLRMDATEPWPFEDGSAESINSEHMIEHIEPETAPAYFAEAFRVLRPGGVLRTSTPDLRGIVDAYLAADPAKLAAHLSHGYIARNHADLLNNYLHMHGHRHIYDFDTLALLLRETGFEHIERAAFGESRHAVMRGIDRHDMGPLASLAMAVDAVKPPVAS